MNRKRYIIFKVKERRKKRIVEKGQEIWCNHRKQVDMQFNTATLKLAIQMVHIKP